MKLNHRQLKFAELILQGLNQTEAYRTAGYKAQSAEVRKVNASRLLTNANVAAYLADRQLKINKRLEEKTNVTKERIVSEYAKVAFASMADFAKIEGGSVSFTDFSKLTPEQLAAVAEVGETTTKDGGSVRLKLYDKIAALTKLGEHVGLFEPEALDPDRPRTVHVNVCVYGSKSKYNFNVTGAD